MVAAAAYAPAAPAAPGDPLFTFSPRPTPAPESPTIPPPYGYLNGPCGLTVDSGGRFYVADHYHDRVDVYDGAADYVTPSSDGGPPDGGRGYITQLSLPDSDAGPCYLGLNASGALYVGDYHGAVRRYAPAAYPPTPGATPPVSGTPYTLAGLVDSGKATGLAVSDGGEVYVAHRDRVSVYSSGGAHQLDIGLGTLSDAYGVAISASGKVFVGDAVSKAIMVFDPADSGHFPAEPSATIDGSATPAGDFTSLRDGSLAIDRASGALYVLDNTQTAHVEQPRARVHVFSAAGSYLGHLKYDVVDGAPTGIAVDNSPGATQGRVYVTSGNTHYSGIYAYAAGSAIGDAPRAPSFPLTLRGEDSLSPTVGIGSAASPPGGIACEGDNCQVLPPDPTDPTLTTLLRGIGNPNPRYKRVRSHKRKQSPTRRHCKRRSCSKRGGKRRATLSSAAGRLPLAPTVQSAPADGRGDLLTSPAAPGSQPRAVSLLPGAVSFEASAYSSVGATATQAGSHPYSLDFSIGLDQSGGEADLRSFRIDLPPGLLLNPATTSLLCPVTAFNAPRSSPYGPSQSGESCPDQSQLGTIELTSALGGNQPRRFGLFELDPVPGAAFRLGASPFGQPIVFAAQMNADAKGVYLVLRAIEVPQALGAASLELSFWGAPWDATHNGERGNCLNEAEPSFPWGKCSVGDPLSLPPRAFLTLPTNCTDSLPFEARVSSWQESGEPTITALNRGSGGAPAPVDGCSSLVFNPGAEGFLSVKKASSGSGYAFRLFDEDPGLVDPRRRAHAQARKAVIELPKGVTLNSSLGAGLQTCSPAQLAAESAFNPAGAGCPNGSKIGVFSVRVPYYDGLLTGGLYLARPNEPGGAPGAENPSDSLIAVYLIAKSADRGILISVPGKLVPDPGDGTLTATFDDLPQLSYTDLEIDFRAGQRAVLVSPPSCGWAATKIRLTPWARDASDKVVNTNSPVTSGVDFGPCPDGSIPPFGPGAVAGGVNANVGSYTPFFVHLTRKDTEQEITSYSLNLPEGITGKIAGVPFCPEAAIAAARANRGFAETANPSCPAASQVGRTETGYGVGPALTYAPGRIYLAGPYGGSPLSLVTINAATVGPFDLGTIVIRSAFDVDERTAKLQIDSSASDPIPHIIDGIPLHLRDVRIYLDRFQFTHNPSSCEPSQLESTLTGSGVTFQNPRDDSTATVAKHFQLLNCLTLGFQPKLGLRLRGGSRRGGYPSLRASFVSRGAKDANLKRLEVVMPRSEFLAQDHIGTVCTRPQFVVAACPASSVYGYAVASTPIFDQPLRGKVYLRSSTHRFPDLVADLYSGAVRIIVEGEIGPSKKGGFRAFFDNLPDAPIERFTMTLFGGKRGLLQNSTDICSNPPLASIRGLAQNNVGAIFTSRLRGQCGKQHAPKGGKPK